MLSRPRCMQDLFHEVVGQAPRQLQPVPPDTWPGWGQLTEEFGLTNSKVVAFAYQNIRQLTVKALTGESTVSHQKYLKDFVNTVNSYRQLLAQTPGRGPAESTAREAAAGRDGAVSAAAAAAGARDELAGASAAPAAAVGTAPPPQQQQDTNGHRQDGQRPSAPSKAAVPSTSGRRAPAVHPPPATAPPAAPATAQSAGRPAASDQSFAALTSSIQHILAQSQRLHGSPQRTVGTLSGRTAGSQQARPQPAATLPTRSTPQFARRRPSPTKSGRAAAAQPAASAGPNVPPATSAAPPPANAAALRAAIAVALSQFHTRTATSATLPTASASEAAEAVRQALASAAAAAAPAQPSTAETQRGAAPAAAPEAVVPTVGMPALQQAVAAALVRPAPVPSASAPQATTRQPATAGNSGAEAPLSQAGPAASSATQATTAAVEPPPPAAVPAAARGPGAAPQLAPIAEQDGEGEASPARGAASEPSLTQLLGSVADELVMVEVPRIKITGKEKLKRKKRTVCSHVLVVSFIYK